jgi:VanZ family protein
MEHRKPCPWSLAVAAWLVVIFFSSTSTARRWSENSFQWGSELLGRLHSAGHDYSLLHFIAEKGVHVTLFTVLAFLLWKALGDRPRKIGLIIVIGATVGSASEGLQSFFPDRDPAVRDILINIGGAAQGALLSSAFARRRSLARV